MSTVLYEFADSIKDLLSTSNAIDFVENMPSPRFIKSHLPLQLLPSELDKIKPKVSLCAEDLLHNNDKYLRLP